MVGVDNKTPDTGTVKMSEGVFDQRPVMDGNEWFGKLEGEGPEAGAKACSQNKGSGHPAP